MNAKELIIEHIRERLTSLKELGQVYSEEKIEPMYEYTPSNYVKPITPPVDSLWQIQDSIRRRREDSVKQRELMLKKYFWPEDF